MKKLTIREVDALATKLAEEIVKSQNALIKAENKKKMAAFKKTKYYRYIMQLNELEKDSVPEYKVEKLAKRKQLKSSYMMKDNVKNAIYIAQIDGSSVNDLVSSVKKEFLK